MPGGSAARLCGWSGEGGSPWCKAALGGSRAGASPPRPARAPSRWSWCRRALASRLGVRHMLRRDLPARAPAGLAARAAAPRLRRPDKAAARPRPELRLDASEPLRHQFELARQRADLRLERIHAGTEPGGVVETLSGVTAGSFLWQHRVRLRLHQRFERAHHPLEIVDLLLEPTDPGGDRIAGRRWRLGLRRRSLAGLRWRRVLLGKDRRCARGKQKQSSCPCIRQARSLALSRSRRDHDESLVEGLATNAGAWAPSSPQHSAFGAAFEAKL